MLRTGRFRLIVLYYLLFAGFSAAIRSLLVAKAWPFLDGGLALLAGIYATGLLFDTVTFFYLALPLVAWTTLVPDSTFNGRIARILTYGAFFLFTYVLLFDAVAEYLFFDEFGTRFNFIAIDYLIYTREVVHTIRESYPLGWILGSILFASAILFFPMKRLIERSFRYASVFRQRAVAGAALALLPPISFALVDVSATHISGNNYANELAGNGLYDLAAAFRSNSLDFDRFYETRGDDAVLARLRRLLSARGARFASDDSRDVSREIVGDPREPEKRWNVIVVVEESLSAEYLGSFGNTRGLTPNLDRLAGESMLFTRLYAAGTRTVRGLEAITLSVPPLPGTSIIKRPGNGGFLSWGAVMRGKGYDTKFLYAGYGYFDDMNAFFSKNGFDIVDRKDFSSAEETFSNAWGVCDEDLFGKVIGEAGKSYAGRRPFFDIVMTTSNHRPFTYPGGRIDIPSGTGRDGGVKYADYALGRFLSRAKDEPWFRDTLFVIVADHCAGSAGKTALPVGNYEIPLFVYSPAHIAPRTIDRTASQIDIAPTVLGLLNARYRSSFLGKDILKMEPSEERAFISTYQRLGFLRGGRLVVLDPRKKVECYSYMRGDGRLTPREPDPADVDDAIAYYQGFSYIHKHGLDRISG